jgi:hypothetical protein
MKHHHLVIAVGLLLFVCHISLSAYQADAPKEQPSVSVFASIDQTVARIRNDIASEKVDNNVQKVQFVKRVNGLLDVIYRSNERIREAAQTHPGSKIPAAYLDSLTFNSRLLNQIHGPYLKGSRERERILNLLTDIASDMTVKAQYTRSSLGAALRLVQAVVNTKDGDRDVAGLEVWYAPKALANTPAAYQRFEKFSTPTYSELAPGNYVMWSKKGDRVGDKVPVTLGREGQSRVEVDLQAPR